MANLNVARSMAVGGSKEVLRAQRYESNKAVAKHIQVRAGC